MRRQQYRDLVHRFSKCASERIGLRLLSVMLCVGLVGMLMAGRSELHAADGERLPSDLVLLNVVIQRLQADGVYQRFSKPECLSYVREERTQTYLDVAVREKHGGATCPGDPETAPLVDRFRVMAATEELLWFDPVVGEFVAYSKARGKRSAFSR